MQVREKRASKATEDKAKQIAAAAGGKAAQSRGDLNEKEFVCETTPNTKISGKADVEEIQTKIRSLEEALENNNQTISDLQNSVTAFKIKFEEFKESSDRKLGGFRLEDERSVNEPIANLVQTLTQSFDEHFGRENASHEDREEPT
ncbi:hypothetical protein K469DRAFT_694716 [Zopfia rhizophila CBS 207.26]|uniref:Uncharacterized protein n=1 Tax=Zopfia rhizophila CBS 207.26 TaxID=1314779 RepID=A0A6A6EMY4_9PEZI|nr:hypothetical protein K469DRAFT_694716 [Zopfia rhizophila CBS 207.26]